MPEQRVPKNPRFARSSRSLIRVEGDEPNVQGDLQQHGPSLERLLKAQLLIALFSVRLDWMFCEQLDYNILFRWFLDMNFEEASFDATTFTKNRERLLAHNVSLKFFDTIIRQARKRDLLSDDHFTGNRTLIDAWASMKSFQSKEEL